MLELGSAGLHPEGPGSCAASPSRGIVARALSAAEGSMWNERARTRRAPAPTTTSSASGTRTSKPAEQAARYHALIDETSRSSSRSATAGARTSSSKWLRTGLILERHQRSFAQKAVGIDLLARDAGARWRARGLEVSRGLGHRAAVRLTRPSTWTCSFKVLAHVPDIARALAEMARVTRPGGVMLAEFYNPWSFRGLAKRLGPAGKISDKTTGKRGLHAVRFAVGRRAEDPAAGHAHRDRARHPYRHAGRFCDATFRSSGECWRRAERLLLATRLPRTLPAASIAP